MDPTLKVKNESNADITLGEGAAAVTIAAGAEQELGAVPLQSRAFAERFAASELRFILTQNPGAERIALGRRIFPGLLRALAPRLLGLGGRVDGSMAQLDRRRQDYNHFWAQTEIVLKTAEVSADGAANLVNAGRHFAFNTSLEQAAEDKLEAELDALEATDPTTIDDLPAFLEQVRAKEAELAKARSWREAAQAKYVGPFASLTDRLDAVAQRLQSVDSKVDIGKQTPVFP